MDLIRLRLRTIGNPGFSTFLTPEKDDFLQYRHRVADSAKNLVNWQFPAE